MTHLNCWSDTARDREPVEVTLSQLGYNRAYVGIMKKILRVTQTPISRQSPHQYLFQDAFCHQPMLLRSDYLTYTHTGQEVYPFGHSCLRSLNRVSTGKGVLFGSTASNCASTFKVIDLYRRRRQPNKHVIVTCDTGFTPILQDIPGSTVTGDARSAVCLDDTIGDYRCIDYQSHIYPAHFGGAWEAAENQALYEKTYKDRIVTLIQKALSAIELSTNARVTVVPHNVNIYSWSIIEKKLNNSLLNFFTDGISDHGHCYGSDAFINLQLLEQHYSMTDSNAQTMPDYFLCVTAGVGGFFSSVTLKRAEIKKEPSND